MKIERAHSPERLARVLLGLQLLGVLSAWGQLVDDGATNVVNATDVNLGASNLVVGTNGSGTVLVITNGGALTNAMAFIGLNVGSANNRVIVTGSNSLWVSTGALYVGSSGSGSSLHITNGAGVRAASAFVGAEPDSFGNLLTVGGGTLTLTNAGGTGVLDVRRGSVVFNGGRITADRLVLTNLDGIFTFNSGTLDTAGGTVSNARAFVVGASAGSGPAAWIVRSNSAPTTLADDLIIGSGVANALSFSGANQYVAITNFGAIAPTNEVTVEFWAFANTNAEHSAFMLEPDEITNRFNAHISFADGRSYWDFGNVSNVNARIGYLEPPNTITSWIHYALVASQSSNSMRIYRNGVLATNRAGMTPFLRRPSELRIGGSTGYFFRGRIDEFRLWNTALSQSQIQSNRGRVISGSESNLLLYYRFDSVSGTVATNSAVATGAAYDGTLVNGPAWIPSGAFQSVVSNTDVASVLVTNGGTLAVEGNTVIGNTASSSNSFVLISGSDSTVSNSGGLLVGATGSFNSLFISNGGRAWSISGAIGQAAGAGNNKAIVNGPGSEWAGGNALEIGAAGAANTLLISGGGRVTNRVGTIGVSAGASNNQVLVTGAGSSWVNSNLNVGFSGSGNKLSITDGGRVESVASYVGYSAGASNNHAVITGFNAILTNGTDVFAGLNGSGNLLLLTNGGRAVNRSGYVGYGAVARNNQAVVDGPDSVWVNSDQLQVGNAGSASVLVITNGGRVVNESGIVGNAVGAERNLAAVHGIDSLWSNNAALRIGNFGSSNTLLIGGGGTVAADVAVIGQDSVATGNLADVGGAGTTWTNRNSLSVGILGSGNLLLIHDGARVINSDGFVGFASGSSSNLVIVTGANSFWTNSGDLHIGKAGANSGLRITNGAAVRAANVYLGSEPGSSGNLLSVGNNAVLTVSNAGATAALDVRRGSVALRGGTINADRLILTNSAGSFAFASGTLVTRTATIGNGLAFVVGAHPGGGGATWDVRSNTIPTFADQGLVIGSDVAGGRLLLTNGGTLVTGGSSTLGESESASNNLAIISGPGSFWTNSGFLYVGYDSSGNALIITNGGRVQNDFGIVGESPLGAGNNNRVIVTGTNSTWINNISLYVGNFGSDNALYITNGATVHAANAYVGAEVTNSGNLLSVEMGNLIVTNLAGTGELDVRGGSAALNGGLIAADRLLLRNPGGTFSFSAGTLDVRSANVSNSAAFTVGDGIGNATLNLRGGGDHVFADSLRLNTNSTLLGSGRILGDVSSAGQISPGSSAGALAISGSLSLESQARMSFEIGGLLATNQYDQVSVGSFVQFAGSLNLALFNGFTPAPGDSFRLMTFGARGGTTFANAPDGGRLDTAGHLGSFLLSYTDTNLIAGSFLLLDSDGDGVGDAWATEHFGHTPLTAGELADDSDGDSASNHAEFIMGTIPTNSASVLRIIEIAPNPSGHMVLRFRSQTNRTYYIRFEDSLGGVSGGSGQIDAPLLSIPAPGVSEWVDDGAFTGGLPIPASRFYRVGVW